MDYHDESWFIMKGLKDERGFASRMLAVLGEGIDKENEEDMAKKITIIDGPNLNFTGIREPAIYGNKRIADYMEELREKYKDIEIEYFQSNHEGSIIDKLQERGFDKNCCGIIINPGAYAHYSYAIADAIRMAECEVVEVHISNIHSREEFRATSVTGRACKGVISGFGLKGYELAMQSFRD